MRKIGVNAVSRLTPIAARLRELVSRYERIAADYKISADDPDNEREAGWASGRHELATDVVRDIQAILGGKDGPQSDERKQAISLATYLLATLPSSWQYDEVRKRAEAILSGKE